MIFPKCASYRCHFTMNKSLANRIRNICKHKYFITIQNINISWTKLGYTRPTLFRELPALKHLDLRWNNLKHMHGKLQLPESFDNLLLAGNPWNCSRLIEWILNERYAEFITDRHLLLCAQKPYINRPVLTVMQYKQVSTCRATWCDSFMWVNWVCVGFVVCRSWPRNAAATKTCGIALANCTICDPSMRVMRWRQCTPSTVVTEDSTHFLRMCQKTQQFSMQRTIKWVIDYILHSTQPAYGAKSLNHSLSPHYQIPIFDWADIQPRFAADHVQKCPRRVPRLESNRSRGNIGSWQLARNLSRIQFEGQSNAEGAFQTWPNRCISNPCYIFLFAVIAFVVACVRARQRIERQSSGGQTVSQPESMALRVHIHHTLSGIVAQIPFDYRRLIQCHMPIHRW